MVGLHAKSSPWMILLVLFLHTLEADNVYHILTVKQKATADDVSPNTVTTELTSPDTTNPAVSHGGLPLLL